MTFRPTRRDCLRTGLATLGAGVLPIGLARAGAAPQNLTLGIMSSVYGHMPVAESASRIKADGFGSVICDFAFQDVRFNPLEPDWTAVRTIRNALEGQGLRVASLFGYYNIVDPDVDRRKRGEARMECLLRNHERLGCAIVSTETGTFNRQSEWVDAPENDTEAGYVQCRDALARLARIAEKCGAVVAVEAYWQNVIRTIERAERLMHEVNSPALKIVMDPCNYYRKDDLAQMRPMLEAMFRALGDQIVIAHAKDVKGTAAADDPHGTELPAAGQGVLDYPLYLSLLATLGRPIDLVVEHLTLADVPRARDFVKGQLAAI